MNPDWTRIYRLTVFLSSKIQAEPTRTATLCNYAYLLHSDKRLNEVLPRVQD